MAAQKPQLVEADSVRRRAAWSFDNLLVGGTGLLASFFCCNGMPRLSGRSQSLEETLVPFVFLYFACTVVSGTLWLEELIHGATLGERREGLRRVRVDGERLRFSDTLRRHWPTLWMLAGMLLLWVLLVAAPPRRETTRLEVEALQQRSWFVGAGTVLPPAAFLLWRRRRGDGTILVLVDQGLPGRRGFEVIVAPGANGKIARSRLREDLEQEQ